MTDDELLAAFDGDSLAPAAFDHAEHVRVGRGDPAAALARFVRGLRALAARAGAPGKFHSTITWAWFALIGERMELDPSSDGGSESGDTWGAFIARHPDLLDRRLLERYYHGATLASPLARRRFVLPDRLGPAAP
jgi:hypothetical protein